MTNTSLKMENIGPIRKAEVTFGDLTILVGPQATGKSIFLQFLKLVEDTGYVHETLRKHGIDWQRQIRDFLDVYLGEGMGRAWRQTGEQASRISVNGQPVEMKELATPRKRRSEPRVFYIPAQRVLSLANGWPRPFQSFASEDPFCVRDFSETFRLLMEQEFSRTADLFPKTNRLKKEYRDLLGEHVFGGFRLMVDRHGRQKRLVLQSDTSSNLIPFLAWSGGQREFVPLLMGLYWLLPAAKTQRRGNLEWTLIEEPEMGLHPNAISVVLLLVMELLWRGYRVCISTHSPHVLDVVWALRTIQQHRADPVRLLELFDVSKTEPMKRVAECVYRKEARVYYFDRQGCTQDISGLDPASTKLEESGWGGLSQFSGRVNEVVAQVVSSDGQASVEATP